MKLTVVKFTTELTEGCIGIEECYFDNINEANDFIKEENILNYEIFDVEVPND